MLLTAGFLDPDFGANGKVLTDFPSTSEGAQGMALQADGKAVVVGFSTAGGGAGHNFALARYSLDGALDNTFSFDGKVATDGWSKLTGHDVLDLARKFEDYGVEAIIYTDIGRDGMLSGVNIEATVRLARELRIPVFASGGVASLDDIDRLCAIEDDGVEGAILGRALYEGRLDFSAAQASMIAWASSMLLTLNAPTANPPV